MHCHLAMTSPIETSYYICILSKTSNSHHHLCQHYTINTTSYSLMKIHLSHTIYIFKHWTHPESTYKFRVRGWVRSKTYSRAQGGRAGKGQSVRTMARSANRPSYCTSRGKMRTKWRKSKILQNHCSNYFRKSDSIIYLWL